MKFIVLGKYTNKGTDGWLDNPDDDRRAMIGAMSLGIYNEWSKCMDEWVSPFLGEVEHFDKNYSHTYEKLFSTYLDSRLTVMPIWKQLN